MFLSVSKSCDIKLQYCDFPLKDFSKNTHLVFCLFVCVLLSVCLCVIYLAWPHAYHLNILNYTTGPFETTWKSRASTRPLQAEQFQVGSYVNAILCSSTPLFTWVYTPRGIQFTCKFDKVSSRMPCNITAKLYRLYDIVHGHYSLAVEQLWCDL